MASFKKFNGNDFAVDGTKRIIAAKKEGSKTAYGGIPMLCDGANRGVYEYHLKIEKTSAAICIGIDEGRENLERDYITASTYHYGLHDNGRLFEKGTLNHRHKTPQILHQILSPKSTVTPSQ